MTLVHTALAQWVKSKKKERTPNQQRIHHSAVQWHIKISCSEYYSWPAYIILRMGTEQITTISNTCITTSDQNESNMGTTGVWTAPLLDKRRFHTNHWSNTTGKLLKGVGLPTLNQSKEVCGSEQHTTNIISINSFTSNQVLTIRHNRY